MLKISSTQSSITQRFNIGLANIIKCYCYDSILKLLSYSHVTVYLLFQLNPKLIFKCYYMNLLKTVIIF